MTTSDLLIGLALITATLSLVFFIIKKYQMKDIHVHIHNHASDMEKKIFETVSIINSKLNTIMANQEQFLAALAKIDAAVCSGSADINGVCSK